LDERFLDLATVLTRQPAVDRDDRFLAPEEAPDLVDQIVERVTVLAEDDQLPALSPGVEHLWRVLQQVGELFPLAVRPRRAHLLGELLELGEGGDLVFELCDRPRRRCLVDELLLELLQLTLWQVVDIEFIFNIAELVGHHWGAQLHCHLDCPSAGAFLRDAALEPLAGRTSDW
jgi:hypothetical protein